MQIFMHRQEQIKDIENKLVSEKAWYEKGEVTAKDRPMNSLLHAPKKKLSKRQKKIKKKTESTEECFDDECESAEFADKIEFIRNKTTLYICSKLEKTIEQIVKQKIKDKTYDNPRKKMIVDGRKKIEEIAAQKTEETERAPLHDIYEGRRTENDKYMDKIELVKLYNEIDKDIANIKDYTYVTSRPIKENETSK